MLSTIVIVIIIVPVFNFILYFITISIGFLRNSISHLVKFPISILRIFIREIWIFLFVLVSNSIPVILCVVTKLLIVRIIITILRIVVLVLILIFHNK